MIRKPALALTATGLLALASCAGADPGASTNTDGPSSPTAAEGPASITLAFAGDTHFENQVGSLLTRSDAAWAKMLPELAAADFAMVNVEAAITDRGSPVAKAFTFRVPPSSLNKLATAGVDAVTNANNHAVDYGRGGLEQTLAVKKTSPIPIVGIGADAAQAFAPLEVNIGGVSTAVLASSEVHEETAQNWSAGDTHPGIATNLDPTRLRAAVRDAAQKHDLVVVFMHWGTEGSHCPNDSQKATARNLEQDGADIIVGTHAHRVQGNGWRQRAFVGYGLGNFIWYNTSASSRPSGVLTLTVDAAAARERSQLQGEARMTPNSLVSDWKWTPKLISGNGEPMSVTGSTLANLTSGANAAGQCTDLRSDRTATPATSSASNG